MANSYRDLIVWQRTVEMTLALYRLTEEFPKQEMFGLTSQLRRAGVSVASNIAEGWGRQSEGEYKHFLGMARGSNMEIQTQLLIASKLGFGDPEKLTLAEQLSHETGKMLVSLMKKIRSRLPFLFAVNCSLFAASQYSLGYIFDMRSCQPAWS